MSDRSVIAARVETRHLKCEAALAALQTAEHSLAAGCNRLHVQATDASGYFPQPKAHRFTDLFALLAAVDTAAAEYRDLLALHAEDACCPIEGHE